MGSVSVSSCRCCMFVYCVHPVAVLTLMCGGGVHSILLLPLVTRCLETIDVCIWRMFVFMSVVVTV